MRRVDFTKIETTVSRTQPLPANFSLFVAGYGQYAFTPLLVSEQCGYGGRFFGRAFDPSQMLGDHCWAALGELRYDIATPWKQLTRLQAYVLRGPRADLHHQAGRRHAANAARHLGRRRRARRLGGHLHGRPVGREGGRRPAQRLARLRHPRREVLRGDHAHPHSPADDRGAAAAELSSARRARWRHVVGGSATISGQGTSHVTVNQSSQNAIVNWHTFNIGTGERTQFVQPNATSITLNRVTGGLGPSQILGSIDANGRVFLVNRDGIIFGAGAVINTAGFLATTNDIRNNDFMAGRYNFNIPGRPDASIVNQGTITATNGGFAALVAPGVRNSGTITANLGTVALGGGNTFSLDIYGDKLITVGRRRRDRGPGEGRGDRRDAEVAGHQHRQAERERRARRADRRGGAPRGRLGHQHLGRDRGELGRREERADRAVRRDRRHQRRLRGRPAEADGARSPASCRLRASKAGTKGGKIVVTGENIEVAGATIDASGRAGGGTVLIGGDWGGGNPNKSLATNQSAVLEGNAIPNATTVSVDAATTHRRLGDRQRRRRQGDPVVGSHDELCRHDPGARRPRVRQRRLRRDVRPEPAELHRQRRHAAPNGTDRHAAARSGGLHDLGRHWSDRPQARNHEHRRCKRSLAANDVIIATNNSINPAGRTATSSSTRRLSGMPQHAHAERIPQCQLDFVAYVTEPFEYRRRQPRRARRQHRYRHRHDHARRRYRLPAHRLVRQHRHGLASITTRRATRARPTSPTGNGSVTTNGLSPVPNQFTAYMLVNNVTDLQNISTNLAGTYALGKDIDAAGPEFRADRHHGFFTGSVRRSSEPHHQQPDDRARPRRAPSASASACSARSAPPAWCATSTSTNATVTANPNVTGPGQFVGILAGSNGGLVSNVTVTNSTVSHGTANDGVVAGGLVGQNGIFGPGASMGTITLSNAAVNVTVGNATSGSLRQQRRRTGRRQSRHDHAARPQAATSPAAPTASSAGSLDVNEIRRHDRYLARDRQRQPVERHRAAEPEDLSVSISAASTTSIRGWRGHRRREHGYLQGRFPGRTCRAAGCRRNDQHVFRNRQRDCRREQLRGRPGRLQQRHDHRIRRRRNGLLSRQYRRRVRRFQRHRSDDHQFLRDRQCERRRTFHSAAGRRQRRHHHRLLRDRQRHRDRAR